MDPRQRLLLQESYSALEDAGYAVNRGGSPRRIGVFVGVEQGDYQVLAAGRGGGVVVNHDAILASRLSYFLNLSGPVMAINTACSSGLVAAHQACQSLRAGECDAAIASAANLILTPYNYVGMTQAGMLSPDGRCYAFDRRANGLVPGEAVVAVVLKRLSQAQADRDEIHAVILASGVNYDGKTNGITAPSGAAQAALLEDIYTRANIDRAGIEYIVTHGTGTRLGDPVEINALRAAFRDAGQGKPYCALTSTKTNFGHTFAASGLVSLVSLVQALRHETIPASLHCEQLSDYIDWSRGPFFVNPANRAWPKRKDAPRRGALSAFGMSGTNAHMVVQGWDEEADEVTDSACAAPCYLLALSGKTEAALQRRAADLLDFLRHENATWNGARWAAISHTLLNHRQHFSYRCAIVVGSREQALHALESVARGERLPTVLRWKVDRDFVEQPMLVEYARNVLDGLHSLRADPERYRQSLSALGDLYCHGYQLDWRALFGSDAPRRISLPTYPFACERFWVETGSAAKAQPVVAAAVLHPLAQRNTSRLGEQRFSSTLSGEEFYVADHVVNGQRVLAEAAYLEMARAALLQSMGLQSGAVELRDIEWVRPLPVQNACEAHIALYADESGEIEFEVYTEGTAEDGTVHAQGRVALLVEQAADTVSLSSLRSRCDTSIGPEQCYAAFAAMGTAYGAAHRGLSELHVGKDADGERFMLGQIQLPACVSDTHDQYVLHPSVLDSALQAGIGMSLNELMGGTTGGTVVPFALERLQVFERCPRNATVWVRRSASTSGSASAGGAGAQKLDLDVCDESGRVCVRLQGFTSRVLEGVAKDSKQAVLLVPGWQAKPAAGASVSGTAGAGTAGAAGGAGEYAQRWVWIDSLYKEQLAPLQATSPGVQWALLPEGPDGSDGSDSGAAVMAAAEALFGQVQQIVQGKPKQPVLLQVVLAGEGGCLKGAVSGLLKTAQQENPKVIGQLLELPAGASVEQLLSAVQENANDGARTDSEIRYTQGMREVAQLKELAASASASADRSTSPAELPWKDGGVYLITGGAGGLGLIFAREIAARARGTTLILTGRSELGAEKQAQLQQLRDEFAGTRVVYQALDVADAAAVDRCVQTIVDAHGTLTGVIHSAGVINDNFILKKSAQELQRVMAAKVAGTINLDEATRDVPLEWMILFSSLAGAFGGVGQCDYAMANAFLDRYARYRTQLTEQGKRHGRTLSINWPLWESGGMRVDEQTQLAMRRQGLCPMATADGIDALYRALRTDAPQVVVFSTDGNGAGQRTAAPKTGAAQPPSPTAAAQIDTTGLQEKVQVALVQAIREELKMKSREVDVEAELSELGFDSISLTGLCNTLNQAYSLELTPTIFFEYPTIRSFAAYLSQEHTPRMAARLLSRSSAKTVSAARPTAASGSVAGVPIPAPNVSRRRGAVRPGRSPATQVRESRAERIAIIGMSGCFPGARDLDAFWDNLKNGRDSISEIPPSRWDWKAVYGDPATQPNKTNIKWGGFINGVDEFDPLYFGISPREAMMMDPQQRLLMTHTLKAIEDAGYSASSLSGTSTGIFVGTINSGYGALAAESDIAVEYSSTSVVSSVGPNRMSFFLNVHGPSEPIETACSSSLVAIHRAVRAMQAGDCEMALVGGINTMLTPWAHISLNAAGMLCEDGRCKTFSKNANGYVRGEGAAMLFLKKLSAAERDRDPIYALIAGSSENHGGRANSLTAPNPKAQAELIKAAYREAQVDPRTVTYIETHGTGTSLGDPIEINGLKSAFAALYADRDAEIPAGKPHCGLGSVKTNIGHLEMAAGVAGLIKVLLQLQHKTLAPSLHCEEVNPYIQLQDSPFYIVTREQPWNALRDAQGRELPRRAGVSSFGFGGANAHVVIEEYCAPVEAATLPQAVEGLPALIVLSARSQDRLQEQARQLLNFLSRRTLADADLLHVAFTLQIGREAMEHRFACTATTTEELQRKLTAYLAGETIDECYAGELKKNKDTLTLFNSDEVFQQTVATWVQQGKFSKLLELWVKGLSFDWQQLYRAGSPYEALSPRRMRLPTYPFARDRYWLEPSRQKPKGEAVEVLHPLVHRNTSCLGEQRFSTTLSAEAFYLSDHVIHGQRILPGVAYLEMARAAVLQSLVEEQRQSLSVELEDVVWMRPLVVESTRQVEISLQADDNGDIEFEVSTQDGEAERVVHAQGRVVLSQAPEEADRLVIPALRSDQIIEAQQYYEAFDAVGMQYGAAHRALKRVQIGEEASGERVVVAQIELPGCVGDTHGQYVLHPSVLDASLQAGFGLWLQDVSGDVRGKGAVPFALERLQILKGTPRSGTVLVRRMESTGDVQKLDVQLCDESGELCVRLQGYTSRILQVGSADSRKPVLLQPVWTSKPAVESTQAGAACEHHWVWLDPAFKAHLDELRRRSDAVRWNVLDSDGSEGAGVISAAEQVFADVQRIMQGKLAQDTLLQVVLGEGSGLAGALSGLMKSAPRENPHLKGQVIELSSDAGIEQLLAALQENAAGAALADIQIRYREGAREVLELKELPAAEQGASPWKDDGVYLITGGTGGLGLIFAREILQRVARPTLILAGLSALNGPAQEKVANLSREFPEARIEYQSMDVSDAAAVTRGIQHILQEHGALHGIVHTAGVIHDNFILKKPMEEISLVLRPKVLGTMHLDEATRDVELDWMLLFSSIAGAFGGVGQSDYSMANAFMDRYAMQSRRRGRIVSINWPLWESGGMRMEASIRESMRRQGLDALSTESGIEVLYRAWSSSASQVVVLPLNGRHATASAAADTPKPPVKEAPAKTAAASDTTLHVEDLQKQASDYLTKLLAGVLKLPADQIESDAGLEKYGIDSILAVKLVTALEAVFGPLPKTLMFEYQSIDALAGYFLASHRAELLTQLGPQQAGSAKPANDGGRAERSTTAVSTAKPASAAAPRRRNVPRVQPRSARNTAQATDVAIIGVSGRYPGARDLDEYWENLKAGKDCITEVPKERWDHSQYFHPEKGQPGKSYTKWGGFIDGVEEFDPLFFNISPREAVWMDPQERLFLQCVYATIEDAGYTRAALKSYRGSGLDGNVGVFVGMMYEEYQLYGAQAQALGQPFALSGNPSSIANRVSYFFNFHGPSMSLDTMCSGSLTAIHLACESLKNNGCELAIAGGVNVTVHPNKYLLLSQGQFASSNGRCESFGKGGDGYVPGEGVGAVLLKPLAQAEADGDHIYAVIKGTSINHGGKTNGYTVPNPVAQAQVIAQALKQSGVDARAISYIEAHGTGTSLGDPIEISGLTQAFSQYTQERQYCAIGSAKSNIGHLESAAGIAGVTKVLLQMKHGLLVPSLHSEVLNPHIDFERTPFRVQRSLAEWQRPVLEANGVKREYPRIAGISSFGAGGSNAHVIVEEYRAPVQVGVPAGLERPALVILSAKSELQLKEQAGRLRMHLSKGNVAEEELRNLAYTLQVGREAFEYRLAFTARTLAEAEEKLAAYAEGREGVEESYSGQVKREKDTLSLLSADEELQEAIDKWVQRGKYGKLLELWVKGLPFDWMRLYEGDAEGERPRRISLPTYPFARERHWVDVTPPSVTSAVPQLEAGTRSERVLVKAWSPAPGSEEARELGAALILCTERTQPFAECIAQGLREAQIVSLDGRQASVGQIDWQRYSTWIDVLGCEPTAHHDLKWTSLLQQWVDGGPAQGALALCVTRGLEAHGNPAPNLGGADRVGLYRMLSSEYARIASRHVDVDPAAAEPTQAQQVVTELSRLRDEIEVCYRDGMRYVAALKEISDNLRHDAALPAWPDEHVLWITGGTRGIGYTCAEHFVRRHGVKRLVLSGRDAFPPREEWQRLQAEQTPMAEKIRSILALEATGAEVRVLSVPLSDEAAVREAVQAIRQSWGPISGVIHCAGLADSGNPAFVRKTVASIQRVLEPKVAGLDCLMNCLAEEPLRFFLLFSSVSAVVPSLGVGYSDYAMANAYMDYVAQAHASRLPILSIQWPSWKETGMGENRSPRYRQLGFFSHTSAEGLSFLDRLLARQWGPVVLPAIVEASQWKPERLMRPPTQEVPQDRQRPVKRDAVPSRQPDSDSTLSSVRTWIVDLVARELRMDAGRIDVDAPLTDYGVDSVMLMQLMKTIGERVGETIDPSLLFEYPTIEGFSGWLARTHGAAFEQADAVTTVSEMRPTDVGVAREVQPPAPITTATATTTTRSTPPPTPTHAATRDVPVGRAGEPAASGRLQPGRVDTSSADIAVVGMSCRFPGAPNVDEYWRLLVEGRSALRRVPPERWGYATDHHAGVLDDANLFDPAFFLISPADARAMDPQALLVLEQSLMLWYQAGYTHADVKARAIGVYLGARSQHFPDEASLAAAANPIMAVGPNYLATNISRFFDLRGPSIVIDTACSSALVAMNMAMQSIRCGEIESALVGGVSLLNNDGALRMFSQRGILNRDVAFHLFDRRATGAILGEGAGMVWLKTVDQALRDGDAIYAVIKGLAINNDGRTAGPAAPNLQAQKDVMLAALARAGRKPQDITHVEVNGSGTEVTDLLELKAIEAVYRPSDATPCELGSMKPNIGHPLCAEGIASFIKGVLTVHHRHSVPFLSAVEPMRHYDLSASPFRFARSAGVPGTGPTTLAINCFADGGTNAHVILEAWNETRAATEVRVPVSAPRLTKVDCRPPRREDVPERSRAPGNEVIPHDTTPRKAGIWGDLSPARVVVKAEVHGKPLVNGHSAIQ
jgi:polyketide synthase PksN